MHEKDIPKEIVCIEAVGFTNSKYVMYCSSQTRIVRERTLVVDEDTSNDIFPNKFYGEEFVLSSGDILIAAISRLSTIKMIQI